jgi:membrane fusion protein, multidrug efflux system
MTDDRTVNPALHREFRPTSTKGGIFVLVLIGVFAALVLGAFALRSPNGPIVASVQPEPLSVEVAEIAIADVFELEETFSGLAEARRTSQLGAPAGGRIDQIRVRVGDKVKSGDVLARIDTRTLQAQLASSEASVAEARAGQQLALDTVERQRTLFAQGHVSSQRVDEAEAQATSAAARVDSAKAFADTLRVQIDLARITAPFDGVITARFADEGAIAGPGQALLEIVEAGQLEAQIGVPSAIATSLEAGKTYTLQSDAGDVSAVLRSVTGVVNRAQRTVAVVFDIDPKSAVPAGSVVRLTVPRTIDEGGFWVPLKALSSASRGLWTVYVAAPSGSGTQAEARLVEMVHSSGDRAFVRGPMQPGDRVIVDGLHRLTPGIPVTPTAPQRAAAGNGG